MDDISVHEFLVQLGPSYLQYEPVFIEEEFRDCSTLRAMDIETDLVQMFKDKGVALPLGHRRKLEDALRNLKSAGDQSLPEKGSGNDTVTGFENIEKGKRALLTSKIEERKELEVQKRELSKDVPMPVPVGNNKASTCSNCHIRGHREFNNRNQSACSNPPCSSWLKCGIKKRHREHGLQLAAVNGQLVKIEREILDLETQIENDNGYIEKLSASFMYNVKPRLKKLDPRKYSDVNILTRDLIALKTFYKGKIPSHPQEDDALEFQKSLKLMDEKKLKSFTVKSEKFNQPEYDNISDDEQTEPPT